MRAFAVALLMALAVLPKTAWVVRNETDVLRGRWSRGLSWGNGTEGIATSWPYQIENLRDPVAHALALDQGKDFEANLRNRKASLADPALHSVVRGPLLRRSFSAAVVPTDGPSSERQRAIAAELLPLAEEGERADPQNAFYSSSAFVLDVILDRPAAARAALARAAQAPRYDDFSFIEPDLFMDGFERQYGYRGSMIRLMEEAGILLPHLTALRNAVLKVVAGRPLDDPIRRDVLRLSETLVRTSPTVIGMLVGRKMYYGALGMGPTKASWIAAQAAAVRFAALRAFRSANPDWTGWRATPYIEAVRNPKPYVGGDPPKWVALAPVIGASLLLALLGGLAAAWPARREPDESLEGRLRRSWWAWLALVPTVAIDDGAWAGVAIPVFAGLAVAITFLARRKRTRAAVGVGLFACALGLALARWGWILPPALWAIVVALPVRGRPSLWVLALVAGGAMATQGMLSSSPSPGPLLGFVIGLLWLRLLLPLSRPTAAWVPAVLVTVYLAGVVTELRADAQIAETMRQWGTEADRFRAGIGLDTAS